MLITGSCMSTEDMARWDQLVRYDAILAASPSLQKSEEQAIDEIERFLSDGSAYCGVSWGKDSTVVAHLVRRISPTIPLVWVRVEPIFNPDCPAVRDAFLSAYPGEYIEIVRHCRTDADGLHATGTLESGFKEAAAMAADRHISGIRAEESGPRKLRVMAYGLSTSRTCAPIGRWRGEHVFAYLHKYNLPIHPAYAMSMGGTLDRRRIRVSSLGGKRGRGWGRREWESFYYRGHQE